MAEMAISSKEQWEARERRKGRRAAMKGLLGKHSLEDSYTRLRVILDDQLDGLYQKQKNLDAGEVDKSLIELTGKLADKLVKLTKEIRGLEKDAYMAAGNMSSGDKERVMLEFFRDMPKTRKVEWMKEARRLLKEHK